MSRPQVAQLTAPGRSALATVAVWGQQSAAMVDQFFRPVSGRPLVAQPLERILFGRWYSQPQDEIGEELTVVRLEADQIEIHCHGGSAAVHRILNDLQQAGCQPSSWQEWHCRQAEDRFQAEAAIAMASAVTVRSVGILMDQHRHALRHTLERILATLDSGDLSSAVRRLERLSQLIPAGMHLTQPFRIAVIGAPNVGKSSLINAIVGYQRSIVYDQPGTTRDLVSVQTAADGWPLELIDTAGWRSSADPVESAGIRLVEAAVEQADVVLRVSELAAASPDPLPVEQRTSAPVLAILNKCDQVSPEAWPPWVVRESPDPAQVVSPPTVVHGSPDPTVVRGSPDPTVVRGSPDPAQKTLPALPTSALTGYGIDELLAQLVRVLVPHEPLPGEAVPFAAWQVSVIGRVCEFISVGEEAAAASYLRKMLSDAIVRWSVEPARR